MFFRLFSPRVGEFGLDPALDLAIAVAPREVDAARLGERLEKPRSDVEAHQPRSSSPSI